MDGPLHVRLSRTHPDLADYHVRVGDPVLALDHKRVRPTDRPGSEGDRRSAITIRPRRLRLVIERHRLGSICRSPDRNGNALLKDRVVPEKGVRHNIRWAASTRQEREPDRVD
ncbi:TPA: hypothetical protein DCE37_13035 [Candidatus Latescibacteria bacterium]|nr:hypothetical protein [Candidatus Latescibacterota bacterium]